MSNQEQCPNCGGYKVETVKKVDNKETNRQYVNVGDKIFTWGVLFLLGGILCATSSELWTGGYGSPNYITPIILISIGILAIIKGWRRAKADSSISLIAHYYYACRLCGYEWDRRADEPLPEVTLRPDLIAIGEQRLAAERKKQQDDAAALYYLTHQGKK